MASIKVENSTMFGGKPFPNWQEQEFSLPGYQNARIVLKNNNTGKSESWGFLISPSSLNVQKSNDIQTSKTMAGWFISRGGPAIGSVSISGFFVDSLHAPERLRFMDMYNSYIEDDQNRYLEFVSEWSQQLLIEGNYYHGLIQNISISKSAVQQFLYQYTITFMFYKTTSAYSIDNTKSMGLDTMKKQMGLSNSNKLTSLTMNTDVTVAMSKGIVNILQGK